MAESVKRKTNRWLVVCFFNVVDISALNVMIIWILNNPEWEMNTCRLFKRLFLNQVADLPQCRGPLTTRASKSQSGAVQRTILTARFQIVTQQKQEEGIQNDDAACLARRTDKHSRDAPHASTSVSVSLFVCCTVH